MARVYNRLRGGPLPDATKRIFLLDGHSLAFRAFFALPTDLATSSGQVTNAVYGFTSMLIKLLAEERPDLIAVAFDKGEPTVRLEKYADYKAGRAETPDEFRQQLPLIVEVLQTLRIPIIAVERHEADDAIATLALRARQRGMEAVVVTADRDFFQLVRPGIRVMFNRRGISDIVMYDQRAVEERFGLPPERYIDYVALKGDPSDNIPGIPGVGEKTASRLVQQYRTAEAVAAHAEELPPRVRAGVLEARDQIPRNKDLARLETELDLDIDPEGCVMGEWDPDEVRRLFNSLEFRTLLERLQDVRTARPPAGVRELELARASPGDIAGQLRGDAPVAVALDRGEDGLRGVALSAWEGRGTYVPIDGNVPEALRHWLADPDRPKWVHDAKELETAARLLGLTVEGVALDTMLAGYLLEAGEASYALPQLFSRYLGSDLLQQAAEPTDGQLPLEEAWRAPAAEAAAVALLAPVLEARAERAGIGRLLEDVELPLARVLAKMQATGVALDVAYLEEMGESVGDRMRTLEKEIYGYAGEEFNLNSPPQLRVILYERLRLTPGKRTKTGYSTDAKVLESLIEEHPIIESILRHREISKLKSTYIDALPRLVDPATGRLHTRFNQTVATTGRLSSENPNLQNIPIRTEEGKQIRRAFIPEGGNLLVVADYSQIELRLLAHLSGDQELTGAFARGDDIHRLSIGKALGLDPAQVTPAQRSIGKMVSYGVTYGMGPFGLSQRLRIPVDQARTYIEGFFATYPEIRTYLDAVVAKATEDGFTTTMLGRRRYLPELRSRNPRVRGLGERQALNAPLQGSAADIMKLAMVKVDRALEGTTARMVLTVHDELVFEVPDDDVQEAAGIIKETMESAVELSVPLTVDLAWGPNWAEAKA